LEYRIVGSVTLDPKSNRKNRDKWSLQEFGADGKKIGGDWKHWDGDLYFTAREFVLDNTIKIDHAPGRYVTVQRRGPDGTIEVDPGYWPEGETVRAREQRSIMATLRPGGPLEGPRGGPTYSMFGTKRTISDFRLHIVKLEDDEVQERCTSWGPNGSISFILHVRPEIFAHYAEMLAASTFDEAEFQVGNVEGIYSASWDAEDKIKVLSTVEEHKVEIPDGCKIAPAQLRRVGEASLILRKRNKFHEHEVSTETSWKMARDTRIFYALCVLQRG
jgi:hypothetical protein